MSTFTLFHEAKTELACAWNMSTNAFEMYLSNDAPVVASDTVKTDVVAITEQNGYAATALTESWAETGAGVGTWRFSNDADVSWTASGGSFGAFQYVVIDNTTVSNQLLGYWDVGTPTTITTGNSFLVDLDANHAIFEIS